MSIEAQKVGQLSKLVIAAARYVAAMDDQAARQPDSKLDSHGLGKSHADKIP